MRLREDWKKIVAKAWSIRFIVLAAGGAFIDGVVQAYTSGFMSALPALAVGAASAAAAIARVVAQKEFADD